MSILNKPISDYKVSAASRNTDKRWKQKPIAEIGISYNQPFHEGQKFESIVHFAAQRFDKVFITLSDTLYRHNYEAEGYCPLTSLNLAHLYGDMWLARNKAAITQFGQGKVSVVRWDAYIQDKDFKPLLDQIRCLAKTDKNFKHAIDTDIARFLDRSDIDKSDPTAFIFKRKSLEYILEEVAVYIMIGRKLGSARLYPGEDLHAFKYMRTDNIPEKLKGLDQSPHAHLSFQRKPSAKKQEAA